MAAHAMRTFNVPAPRDASSWCSVLGTFPAPGAFVQATGTFNVAVHGPQDDDPWAGSACCCCGWHMAASWPATRCQHSHRAFRWPNLHEGIPWLGTWLAPRGRPHMAGHLRVCLAWAPCARQHGRLFPYGQARGNQPGTWRSVAGHTNVLDGQIPWPSNTAMYTDWYVRPGWMLGRVVIY